MPPSFISEDKTLYCTGVMVDGTWWCSVQVRRPGDEVLFIHVWPSRNRPASAAAAEEEATDWALERYPPTLSVDFR